MMAASNSCLRLLLLLLARGIMGLRSYRLLSTIAVPPPRLPLLGSPHRNVRLQCRRPLPAGVILPLLFSSVLLRRRKPPPIGAAWRLRLVPLRKTLLWRRTRLPARGDHLARVPSCFAGQWFLKMYRANHWTDINTIRKPRMSGGPFLPTVPMTRK